MNTRILTPRIVERASITAASQSAGGLAINLLDPQPGLPWICPDPSLASFDLDIGAATLADLEIDGYDTVFLGYGVRTEAGREGTVTLTFASTSAGMGSPAYSTGARTFLMTPDIDPTWAYIHFFAVLPSAFTYRFMRAAFNFPDAAAVHLSLVVVDKAVIPRNTLAPNFGMTPKEDSSSVRSLGGADWTHARPAVRSGPLLIESSGPGAASFVQGQLAPLYRQVGNHSPVVLIVDDAPTEFAMDKVIYGKLSATTPFPLAQDGFGLYPVGFEMTEVR